MFSCLTGLVPSILLSLTHKGTGSLWNRAPPSLVGAAQGGVGSSPWAHLQPPGHEGTRRPRRARPVPGPPEEKETSRDRQLRDRQETGTGSAQMQEPRSELQTKVIRQAVLNSRASKGFIGRAPSGKSAEAPGLAPLRPSRLGVVQTCRGRSQAQGGQVEPSLGKTATPSSGCLVHPKVI